MVRALSLLPILLKLVDNLTPLPETPAAAAIDKRVALVSHKKSLPRGLIVARGQFHAGKSARGPLLSERSSWYYSLIMMSLIVVH